MNTKQLMQGCVMMVMICAAQLVNAWDFAGTKVLSMQVKDGQSIKLGTVKFEPVSADKGEGKYRFTLAMDHARFNDHFLSMKEFKCVEGPRELMCHVPYPYKQPATVSAKDLAWLEHSLMFLFKLPNEFGAKLWNGMYFQFTLTDKGLVGKPQAIDLNMISAPPDKLDVPPYRPAMRDDISPGSRWVSSLTIE